MPRLVLLVVLALLPSLLKAQSDFVAYLMLGASLSNLSHFDNGLSDNVVKSANYQYYFENTPANYLVDYDALNEREVWVFPKSTNRFATYFLVREEGDLAILCSTEIKDACKCRWDLYAYRKSEDKIIWLRSKNLFSVRNEVLEMLQSESDTLEGALDELKFCELMHVIQE